MEDLGWGNRVRESLRADPSSQIATTGVGGTSLHLTPAQMPRRPLGQRFKTDNFAINKAFSMQEYSSNDHPLGYTFILIRVQLGISVLKRGKMMDLAVMYVRQEAKYCRPLNWVRLHLRPHTT